MQWENLIPITLLGVHILLCILIAAAMALKWMKIRRYMLYVALFLPIWGPALVLILNTQMMLRHTGEKELEAETFTVESELYKSITRESGTHGAAISMEEALIVNTPKERRALIMNVLNDDPKDYVDLLKKAGNNEDTEVVHYAVTAMVDISNENDSALWELEKRYCEAPEDIDILTEYCELLWNCLDQGLMQGQVEKMNRNLFDTLIHKKILLSKPPCMQDYIRGIENSLKLDNFSAADALLEEGRSMWPNNEALFLLKIRYAALTLNAAMINELLSEAEHGNIYLSAKAKEVIAFWKE